jgi:SAM-dependent methyltransferase
MRNAYRCPKCKSPIFWGDTPKEGIFCSNCEFSAPIISGVPVFTSIHAHENSINTAGLGEKLFSKPQLYKIFVTAKTIVWKDKEIGIDDYIKGKNILDVGCGPSLNNSWQEYRVEDANTVTAVDVSLPFVLSAKKENPDEEKFDFAVASIDNLPYPDKSFDATIVAFVIHHLPPSDMPSLIEELKRVTKNHIIIFDHVRSDNRIRNAIQSIYWKAMDGGCNYMTTDAWKESLSSLDVVRKIRTGAIFGHVVKFICSVG